MTSDAKIPDIPGARPMTRLELNAVRFPGAHTPLTPEMLEAKDPS